MSHMTALEANLHEDGLLNSRIDMPTWKIEKWGLKYWNALLCLILLDCKTLNYWKNKNDNTTVYKYVLQVLIIQSLQR